MATETLVPAEQLTERERADLNALALRRDALARSAFNRRAHALIEHSRILLERVQTFLEEFGPDEALNVLDAAFPDEEWAPAEPYRWGAETFREPRDDFRQLVADVGEFLKTAGRSLPPLVDPLEPSRD